MPTVVFQQIAQPGPGYAATSTTSVTIGTGSKSFTVATGLAYSAGARVRISYASDGTKYMEGLVTSYSGASLVVNVDAVGGSGTFANWNVNLAGNIGTTGPVGPGYLASSTTSLTPATGSKTFTTQSGLAYLAGLRVRAVSASDATVWMEGLVYSYSGTSLVLTVDLIGTATTKADWNIGAAGSPGAAGTNGTNASALNYRGAYVSGTTYAQGDGVTYSGILYGSLVSSNTGQQPDISPTYWQSFASSGANANGYYFVSQATNAPANSVNLGALTSGLVKITVSGSVATPSTASAGTDYAPATSGTSILKGNGSGGFSNAASGTDYQAPVTLTTTGTSGAATLVGSTLNVPQYSSGSSGAGAVSCRVHNVGTVALTGSSSTTAITWDTEDYDIGGCHDTTTNPSRFTVPTAQGGIYRVTIYLPTAGGLSGSQVYYYSINGGSNVQFAQANALVINASFEVSLNAGDYLILSAYNSGSSQNLSSSAFACFTRVS